MSNRLLIPRHKRKLFAPALILPGMQFFPHVPVVPGTVTITATQDWTVPNYNTITIDLYGAGGGGCPAGIVGGDGGDTTIVFLGLTASGGDGGIKNFPPVPAPATGFNTTSTAGTTNVGVQGCAGSGPLGGAQVNVGTNGNIYGGGGGAGTSTPGENFGDGGEGGAYGRHVLVVTSGTLPVGQVINVVIGAGGLKSGPSGAVTPGDGAQGAAVITWS